MPTRREFIQRSAVAAAVQRYPQKLRLANASTDAFYAGLVRFEPVQGDLGRVVAEFDARNIRLAGGPGRIRLGDRQVITYPPAGLCPNGSR